MSELTDPDAAVAPVIGHAEDWLPGNVPAHTHHRHQLMYSLKGVMHISTPHGRWVLPPLRAIWISSGTEHSFVAKRLSHLHILYIDPDVPYAPPLLDCAVLNVTPLVRELVSACVQLPWDYAKDSKAARLARVLLESLDELPQAPVSLAEPQDPRARKVVAALNKHPENRYTLEDLAAVAAASPRTLERIFLRETGFTLSQWQSRLRLLYALELLADGPAIATVAAATGYSSASSFTVAFKALFGVTPGRYFA